MRLGTLIAIFGLLLIPACDDQEETPVDLGPNVSRVEPSTPLGTVWGAVLKAGDHDPLEQARVSLSVSDEIRTTDTDDLGMFSFSDVPAGGEAGISIRKDGYSRATLKTKVPGAAGDFPADGIGAFVGPVALFPLDGTADVQLIDDEGNPIDDVVGRSVASAAWVDLADGIRSMGIVSSTTISENGHLRFTGLPNLLDLSLYGGEITFSSEPVYDSSDNLIYMGHSESHSAADLFANGGRVVFTLRPPGANEPLEIIAGNVGSLRSGDGIPQPGDSVIGTNEAVRLVFNQPLDPNLLQVTVFEQCGENEHQTQSNLQDGNVLRVLPHADTYTRGRAYRIIMTVQPYGASPGGSRTELHGSFFITPPEADIRVIGTRMVDETGSGALEAGDRVFLDLSQAVGFGGGAAGFSFPVYLDLDLDGSGTTGTARGELGSDEPIWATEVEPIPPHPMQKSGFTRHFMFEMPVVPPADSEEGVPYSFDEGFQMPFMIDLGSNHPDYDRLMKPTGELVNTPAESESVTIGF